MMQKARLLKNWQDVVWRDVEDVELTCDEAMEAASVVVISCAKMAEPIEMSFGV